MECDDCNGTGTMRIQGYTYEFPCLSCHMSRMLKPPPPPIAGIDRERYADIAIHVAAELIHVRIADESVGYSPNSYATARAEKRMLDLVQGHAKPGDAS